MRILDNKKDYYDYLAGILGIDEYITYDRRKSTRLVNKTSDILSERYPLGFGACFCTWKNGVNPKKEFPYPSETWDNGNVNAGWAYRKYGPGYRPKANEKFPDAYNVSCHWFDIVIGSVAYMFLVYRVLQNVNDKEVKLVPVLIRKFTFDRSKTKSKAPILIGGLSYSYNDIPWNIAYQREGDEYYKWIAKVGYIAPNKDGDYDENPILADTWIPSLIPAEEVWNNISDFLLSIKEPKIVDNRTDVQHLESHGFDKKTSFRNVK